MSLGINPRIVNEPRLRAMMAQRCVDAILLRGVTNTKYLGGFFHNGGDHDGSAGHRPFVVLYCLDPARPPVFIVPSVDLHLAMASSWIADVRAYATAEFHTDLDVPLYSDFETAARAVLDERGIKGMTVGTEGDQLSRGFAALLDNLLAGNRIVDVGRDIALTRMVKTDEEIRRIRRAIDWTVAAHESFRAAIRPGVTDRELYSVAARRMIDEGSEGHQFIFVGTGPTRFAANARFPTGQAIQPGDFLRVDMGASCLGYSADFVRSYYLGQSSERARDMWRWLCDVEMEVALSIKPGDTGGEIFERGHRAISRHINKFPREFIGHGIGLIQNEEPRMCRDNRVPIEPGTVYCVEFSAYLDDGARPHVEDMYLLTETGVEILTRNCPRDLIVPI
jgi:Xaa-Pro aminopeptidase